MLSVLQEELGFRPNTDMWEVRIEGGLDLIGKGSRSGGRAQSWTREAGSLLAKVP